MPLSAQEYVYAILDKLAEVIGVQGYRRSHISIAHRLKMYSKKHLHPPIIVQFVSRSNKEEWIAAAIKKKDLNAKEVASSLPGSPVFISHHMTAHNKALLGRARRLFRQKKLCFAKFVNGKVLVKVHEGDAAVRVFELSDLEPFDPR